jgi:diguanylate cyclase (GGDEF)-like protein
MLLNSGKILAEPVTETNFEKIIGAVERSLQIHPDTALALLHSYRLDLTLLTVAQRMQYYYLVSDIYADNSSYLKSKTFANKGLALSKELDSPRIVIAQLLYAKGFAHESLGEVEKAELIYEKGLELAKALDDKELIIKGLIDLGAIYYLTHRFKASLSALNEAYILAYQTDSDELKGLINNEIGILYAYLNQDEKSVAYYRKAYQHYTNIGYTPSALNALNNIANNLSRRNKHKAAIEIFKEIIDGDDIKINSFIYRVYLGYARALLKQDESNPEAALKYILLAENHKDDSDQYDEKLSFLYIKTEIFKALERYKEALEILSQADLLLKQSIIAQQQWYPIYPLLLKAELFNALNRHEDAYLLITDVIAKVGKSQQESNLLIIDDLRLSLASKQADIRREILEKNTELTVFELAKSESKYLQLNNYLFASVLLTLSLAWLVFKLSYGHKSLLKVSRTDNLTGLFDRRYTLRLGARLFNHAVEKKSDLCVFMIDVDHFKQINDSFGHQLSDQVLTGISTITNNTMSPKDVFGCLGGEKFVAFFPNTSLQQGVVIAQRLRLVIDSHQWSFKTVADISISIGVSTVEGIKAISIDVTLENLLK